MKRGFTTLLLSISATGLFSTAAFAAGWATNQQGQQVYQNDNGSIATNTWIKMSQGRPIGTTQRQTEVFGQTDG